ncbi:lysM domain receptor-like kinase 3 [Zingiber officinale]|uniref:Uncharacterized protein n=1 Tax=Zingiber officinale TaxID=94328 RepID=A0A8J5HE19_ZINOF|nr:lysM domain receptor-like kinase 3 [Zingiber officinale]KAG6522160.1 hypothetical protein ZIOFF_019297 [Zingiber officinale]
MAAGEYLLLPAAAALLFLSFFLRCDGEPMACDAPSPSPLCEAFLYVRPRGLDVSAVADQFAANASLIQAFPRGSEEDYLVSVPCACERPADANLTALFHDAVYEVKDKDTADYINATVFSGLAWRLPANVIFPGNITVHLPCGCWTAGRGGAGEEKKVVVVSYAVQADDTLTTIADFLDTDVDSIIAINAGLSKHPNSIPLSQLLFVPMGAHSSPELLPAAPHANYFKGKQKVAIIALGISISFLSIILIGFSVLFHRRRRSADTIDEKSKANSSKITSTRCTIAALESRLLTCKNGEATAAFRTERPVIFSLEEVDQATASFEGSRKIGEGGYGSVYFGILANEEVAIKKMKSSKSKEFLAELNVLCNVHHRNVVELIGYAAGEDYLYLVYEFVQNGSLNENLHDPLLKGHLPLSWTARTQIALDTACGIEYIHEHTKTTCVHRDIKTSNILLDSTLRAKVADFGLAKLVEEHREEEGYLATRLVGTPGYLPPESVRELQMTTKSDVFAFGVVLSELVTGQRALTPDRKDPSKMRSLATIMKGIFLSEDPESAIEEIIDPNLNHFYPAEEVHKMVHIAMWCLSDDPVSRPEMREITANLLQILMASIEWEASLGGNSQVFSGIFGGR